MKKFFYKAIKNRKELVSGYIEAETKEAATDKIRGLGFLPSCVQEEKVKDNKVETKKAVCCLPMEDLILFTDALKAYIESEIPILSALDNISRQAGSEVIKNFADKLAVRIKSGKTLSQAIEEYSEVVGEAYAVICRTGEEFGTLGPAFGCLSMMLKKQEELLHSSYIKFLVCPTVLIGLFVGLYLLFGYAIFYSTTFSLGSGSSFWLKLLSLPSDVVKNYWWVFVLIVTSVTGGQIKNFNITIPYTILENLLMRLSVAKNYIIYMSLSRYMTVLNFSYKAGVPLADALRLAENSILNDLLRNKAKMATDMISQNKTIAEAYLKADLMPNEIMSIITEGEKTNKLEVIFGDVYIEVANKLNSLLNESSESLLYLLIFLLLGCSLVSIVSLYMQMFMYSIDLSPTYIEVPSAPQPTSPFTKQVGY